MLIDLHSFAISLISSNEHVIRRWRQVFDIELANQSAKILQKKPVLVLEAEVRNELPQLTSSSPTYESSDPPLKAYLFDENNLVLRLSNFGHIQFQFSASTTKDSDKTGYAKIVLTEPSLEFGALEGMTTLALAPVLRRRGLFLIHASAASDGEKAVMFVGPSGSGKTSSGLALIYAGWHFLANDVALVRQTDAICALLSPGTVQITTSTSELLPYYADLFKKYPLQPGQRKISVPRSGILPMDKPVRSAAISLIFFPTINKADEHVAKAVPRAVGLARLMKSSMDQWDPGTWEAHVGFLEKLSYEVEFYDLHLGKDMTTFPHWLESAFAKY